MPCDAAVMLGSLQRRFNTQGRGPRSSLLDSADQLPVAICWWHKRDACDKNVFVGLWDCDWSLRISAIRTYRTGHRTAQAPSSFRYGITYASTPEPILHHSFELQGICFCLPII